MSIIMWIFWHDHLPQKSVHPPSHIFAENCLKKDKDDPSEDCFVILSIITKVNLIVWITHAKTGIIPTIFDGNIQKLKSEIAQIMNKSSEKRRRKISSNPTRSTLKNPHNLTNISCQFQNVCREEGKVGRPLLWAGTVFPYKRTDIILAGGERVKHLPL